MKKFILALLFVVGLASLVHAAVEVKSAGTRVGKAETLNITGPTITSTGNTVALTTLAETGDKVVTGSIKATVDIVTDASIYQTAATTGGVGLWLSQPDGGCSLCGVDAAGTTFACTNQTCPPKM